jgi:hypothetical protein
MPSYTWVCGACATSNPPEQADCVACGCPAQSSQQLRHQYRAAFEGVGPPVVPKAVEPAPRIPRHPAFKPGTLWFAAAATFLGVTVIAFILLWGGGPLLSMGGGPREEPRHWYWTLPDGLMFACLLAVLLAPPVALGCAIFGFVARNKLSISGPVGWGGLLLVLVLLLSMCSG